MKKNEAVDLRAAAYAGSSTFGRVHRAHGADCRAIGGAYDPAENGGNEQHRYGNSA